MSGDLDTEFAHFLSDLRTVFLPRLANAPGKGTAPPGGLERPPARTRTGGKSRR
jgi:hypothetical protein